MADPIDLNEYRRRKTTSQTSAEPNSPAPQKGSRISNIEWGLVIGATAIIDIIQFILDFFVIGVAVNRFIDVAVGMILPFYFWMRGVKADSKKLITWIGSFLLEEFPGVDALPLWTGDVLATMAWDKIDKNIDKLPGASAIQNSIDKAA